VGGGWERINLIRLAHYLPLCLPLCHTQTGPVARRFGESIFPSACTTQLAAPGSSPRGSAVPHHPRDARTRMSHTAGGGGMGRVVMCGPFTRGRGKGNRTPLGRFADVNWGSRPFGHRVVGEMGRRRGRTGYGEGRGWTRGTKWMKTHRLLGLSAHDKGIGQRRSRRSRHFSLYFSSVVSASLSAELVRQTTRRSWKLNRLSANTGASVHFGSRISHTRVQSLNKYFNLHVDKGGGIRYTFVGTAGSKRV